MEGVTYFHELPEDVWQRMKAEGGLTWGELAEKHPQPVWCGYPGALQGLAGCWSLTARYVTGEAYCQACECYCGKLASAA